jgi:predicted transcriptional regulator
MGARKRSYQGHYSQETAKNTPRNIFKGQSELNQLAKGIYENLETNYEKKHKKEELEILQNDVEIQQMIENLDKRSNKDKKNGKV